MLAFALTAYDDETESIEDPDIGELKAYYKTWGYPTEDEVLSEQLTLLETRQCTYEELGIKKDGTPAEKTGLFYRTHSNSLNDLKYYNRKFKCFALPNISIHGDYNTSMSKNIIIQFEKCDQEKRTLEGDPRACKSNDEILRWLRQKYLLIYYNLRRFKIGDYKDESKIVEESRTKYIPFNTQIREDIVLKTVLTDLNLQDSRISFSNFGSAIKRVFRLD